MAEDTIVFLDRATLSPETRTARAGPEPRATQALADQLIDNIEAFVAGAPQATSSRQPDEDQ